jgi:hypothetical protein
MISLRSQSESESKSRGTDGTLLQRHRYTDGTVRTCVGEVQVKHERGGDFENRSNLKDADGFEGVYVNRDRTPEEREKVWKAVVEMKKLRENKKEAYVTLQGDLVVIGEGGERRRTYFALASPWAVEAAETRKKLKEAMKEVEEQSGESFVEVTRRGRGKKVGSTKRA